MASYVKILQTIEMLWTGQSLLSQLTLKFYDPDLGPSHTDLVQCTSPYDDVHLCKVLLHSVE